MVILSGVGSDEEIKNLKEIEEFLNEIDDNKLELFKFVAKKQTEGNLWQPESNVLRFAYGIKKRHNFAEKKIEGTIHHANKIGLLNARVKHNKQDITFEEGDEIYYNNEGIKVYHMRDDVVEPILNMSYRNPRVYRFGNKEFE